MSASQRYVATCPKGVEGPLAEELRALGAADVRETRAAASFSGPLELAYRACLWSRLASRVLLELAEFGSATAEELYEGAVRVPWEEHLTPDSTLAVSATGTTSGLTHSGFAARKVKDAVVDRSRERTGRRPSVDLERPDVQLDLRLHRERATLSLDLAGVPLHRRGYRVPGKQVEAPLKENLAAAILVRAGWPRIASDGGSLVDPMCGSGTLLVEGALMAADQAPGLLRQHWGFLGWLGHDAQAWARLVEEADERAETGRKRLPPIVGSDEDAAAVQMAQACAMRAGLKDHVRMEVAGLDDLRSPKGAHHGLVVTNPPYGLRLDAGEGLGDLYALLGERLVAEFEGWRAALFTAKPELARATRLRSKKAYTLYNGAVETKLYLFDVSEDIVKKEVRRTSARQKGPE